MILTNTPAYYDMESIMAVKGFIVQARDVISLCICHSLFFKHVRNRKLPITLDKIGFICGTNTLAY